MVCMQYNKRIRDRLDRLSVLRGYHYHYVWEDILCDRWVYKSQMVGRFLLHNSGCATLISSNNLRAAWRDTRMTLINQPKWEDFYRTWRSRVCRVKTLLSGLARTSCCSLIFLDTKTWRENLVYCLIKCKRNYEEKERETRSKEKVYIIYIIYI